MATQTVQFAFLTGQTVTVKLFADDGSDTVLATPSASEATNRTGIYSFTQTDRAAGTYLITVSATGINAAYTVQLTLTTATFWAHERTHANVTQFGGTNGTFSSGRPEVNTTQLAGQAVTAASGVTFPSSLASPTNITAATGITVSTNNDKTGYTLTQAFPTNFSSLAITGAGAVTAGTVSDKTGYSLSSSQTFNLTGDITGNLSGSVGSVTAAVTLPTIPTNWITSTGIAASALNGKGDWVDTTNDRPKLVAIYGKLPLRTYLTGSSVNSGAVDSADMNAIADTVWEDLEADHTTAGTMGSALGLTSAIKTKTDNLPSDPADASDIASSFSTVNSTLATIAGYIDTEILAIKNKTDNLPSDPADASDIASSFTAVNTKLDTIASYVDTEIASMKTVTDRLGGMLVQDGLVYQFTANALELAPSGGGGSTTVAVYPLNASQPARVYDTNLVLYKNESGTVVGPIAITSRNGNVITDVSLSGRTLSVRFVDYTGTELLTVDNADITVSGTGNNQISFPVTTDLTGTVTEDHQDQWHIWTLHDLTSGDNVIAGGKVKVLLC